MELSLMATRVMERLPDLQLATDGEVPLRPANFVSGPESMPVVFTPSGIPAPVTSRFQFRRAVVRSVGQLVSGA
jgi:hypothetical protein